MKITGRHFTSSKHINGYTFVVELHVTPFRNYEQRTDSDLRSMTGKIFANVRSQEFENVLYPVFGHEDNVLALCTHFARHSVEMLTSFCTGKNNPSVCLYLLHEIAMYLDMFGGCISTEQLLSSAKEYGCVADLAYTTKCLGEVYGFPIYNNIGADCGLQPEILKTRYTLA